MVPKFNNAGLAKLVDHIDAHMFSSDTFRDANDAAALVWYMGRWQKELDAISAFESEAGEQQ